jgi:hypothetical protein
MIEARKFHSYTYTQKLTRTTMHTFRIHLFTCLLLQAGHLATQVSAQTCYNLVGDNAGPKNIPCVANVTGEGDSHSSCCNGENNDACLSTGLCFNTIATQNSHLIWSSGCTDPTMQHPSCPKFCLESKCSRSTSQPYFVHSFFPPSLPHYPSLDPLTDGPPGGISNARLNFCNDTRYCCQPWNGEISQEDCCRNGIDLDGRSFGIVVAQLAGTSTSTPTPAPSTSAPSTTSAPACSTTSSSSSSSDIPTPALAGLVVEGALLALSLALVAYLLWRQRRLNRQLSSKQAEMEDIMSRPMGAMAPPGGHVLVEAGGEEATVVVSELDSLFRRELPGDEYAKSVLSSSPPPLPHHPSSPLGSTGMKWSRTSSPAAEDQESAATIGRALSTGPDAQNEDSNGK